MKRVSSDRFCDFYAKPFDELLEAGFGSWLEMDCLNGLVGTHLRGLGRPGRLFEIGTHRGAGVCNFRAMDSELEIHSLNILPEDLLRTPAVMASEIIPREEIGCYARERGISFTQHYGDSRCFDWEDMGEQGRFDIVFIDGSHQGYTVVADTLNALRILEPGGLLIWHDYKVIDEPGREVFAALNDLDEHEFGGEIRYIEGTWLAYALGPGGGERGSELAVGEALECLSGEEKGAELSPGVARHLRLERRRSFSAKVRTLPAKPEVLFFSDHRNPVWPAEDEEGEARERYQTTRDPRRVGAADIVVFHLPAVPNWHRLPKAAHQLWVGVTMEPDDYYPWQRDPGRLASLDLLLSNREDADVRLDFTSPGTLEELRRPVPPKDSGHVVCALVSNADSRSERERLILQLENHIAVHHYGAWRYNGEGPRRAGRAAKLEILGRYQFCLAFENAIQRDLVTEKFYDCLVAGCVPVYLGAPNIEAYAPGAESYLDVREFRSMRELAERLLEISEDAGRYAAFFDWKDKVPTAFRRIYEDEEGRRSLLEKIDRVIEGMRGIGVGQGY
jgi:hypothetical protein